jgi:L-fucose isomerase
VDGTLARQVRLYLAVKDFCKLEGIDFCGLTGQLDWTEWEDYCIMDVAEALLNDTSDWEEERKKVIVCATECDSNGGLTMQLLHHLSNTPVLFADLRHYHEDRDVYDLTNSGQHAPWLSKFSDDFRVNWKEVTLHPALDFYFKAPGASVEFFTTPRTW